MTRVGSQSMHAVGEVVSSGGWGEQLYIQPSDLKSKHKLANNFRHNIETEDDYQSLASFSSLLDFKLK